MEINHKYIIIGVYSGDVLVPQFPFQMFLAIYMEYVPEAVGQYKIFVRFIVGDEKPISGEIELNVQEANVASALVIPKVVVQIDKELDFKMECSADGKKWEQLMTKKIRKGQIPTFSRPNA